MSKNVTKMKKAKVIRLMKKSIFDNGPKHNCSEIRSEYVPDVISVGSFYRWMKEVKVAPPSKAELKKARQQKAARKRNGKAVALDDQLALATIVTQGFSGIDHVTELQDNIKTAKWAQEGVIKIMLANLPDKASADDLTDAEKIEVFYEGVEKLTKILNVRSGTLKAASQIQVQLLDQERFVAFLRSFFEEIKKESPEVAKRIIQRAQKIGIELGQIGS